MNTLQFQPATRPAKPGRPERPYWDFIVSNRSWRDPLGPPEPDLVTSLGWPDEAYEAEQIQVFTFRKEPDLPTGRTLFYVCPECGDVNCGAVTATVQDRGDRIVWTEFGYETGYGGLTESYTAVEPIKFERQSYFQAFSRLGLRSAIQKILRHR